MLTAVATHYPRGAVLVSPNIVMRSVALCEHRLDSRSLFPVVVLFYVYVDLSELRYSSSRFACCILQLLGEIFVVISGVCLQEHRIDATSLGLSTVVIRPVDLSERFFSLYFFPVWLLWVPIFVLREHGIDKISLFFL